MANNKKKPNIKELTKAVIDVNKKVNQVYNLIRGFDSIFTIYLDLKGDKETLEKKLTQLEEEHKKKQDEEAKNGKANNPNLQGDTDGESSRTEGVRAEGK